MVVKIVIGMVILMLLVMIVAVVIVFVKPQMLDKTRDKNGDIISSDGKQAGTVKAERVGDTKSFIPIKSIDNYSFDMGRHTYRAIIECSSVNYELMSQIEQDMVESTYVRFLNSLSFPISTYMQTREFDNALMLENLHKNRIQAEKRFPSIKSYGSLYEEEMGHLTEYIENSKIKKKYIIVPYNRSDLKDMSALKDYEIKEFAIEELMNRCSIVMGGISSIGLSAKLLNRGEIAEVLYSYYHRDMYKLASDIADGIFTSLVVTGEEELSPNKRITLDSILLETQNKIKDQLYTVDMSDNERVFYKYIVDCLEYFKQDDRSADIFTLLDRSAYEAYENGYGNEFEAFTKAHPENFDEYKRYHSEEGVEEIVPRIPQYQQ